MSRKGTKCFLALAALCIAIPMLAQESLPFATTRDKKLIAKVKVDGKERLLILDTGAVDLLLDPSVVGMKPSDLKERGPWNPNGTLKIAQRRVIVEIAGKKFGITAAILDCRPVSEIAGNKVDGIMGIAIFQKFKKVTIDFKNSRLELF